MDDTAVEWNGKMYDIIDDALDPDNSTEFNIRYYVTPGCNHTILGSPKFYEEVTDGHTVVVWVNQMLGTGLAGLPNVDCLPDCDTKPEYPSEGEFCD